MAIANFIPTIWNAQLMLNFHETVVAAALANRAYEGDATKGNTVRIATAVDVAVKDYKAAGRTTSADAVDLSTLDLLIDQEKSFDFYVDDIDRAQVAGSMGAYTTSAAIGMAEDVDKYLLAQWVGAATAVDGTTTSLANGDAAFNVVRDLRKSLNKSLVPQSSRVIICNAEFEAVLLDAASKLTAVNTSGSPAGLRDAAVGRLLGFDVYMSENLPVTGFPQALAIHTPIAAFVSQVQETEAMRAQDKFADRLRGLHVYGAKLIRSVGATVYTATA